VYSGWLSHTNYISIRFGTEWDPDFNQDDDSDTAIHRSEVGPDRSSEATKKYMIGGPLCEPTVTGEAETAAKAVHNQSSRVKAGTDLNHIFGVIAANRTRTLTSDYYRETLPDIEDLPGEVFDADVDTSCPIRTVSGIGDTTVKRFASRFGVYPNLSKAEWDDFNGLLPGYSHSVDFDEMDTITTTITEHYQNLSKQPDWPTTPIDLDQFEDYPKGNPTYQGDI
jgi:hypothetical protein